MNTVAHPEIYLATSDSAEGATRKVKLTPQQVQDRKDRIDDLNRVVEVKEKMRLLLLAVWGLDAIAKDSMIEQPWTTPILTLANEVDTMVGKLEDGRKGAP